MLLTFCMLGNFFILLMFSKLTFKKKILSGTLPASLWEHSGSVVESLTRPRGRGFEPHLRHCVLSLSKTHLSLLSTG